MVKRKKNKLLIGIIITVLSLISILIAYNLSDGFGSQIFAVPDLDSGVGQCSGGWTTLSTSDVNIEKVGDRIRVFGVAKGSECLAIKLYKEDLNDKLEDKGLEATRDIAGNIRLLKYTKTFPIDKSGNYYPSIESGTFGNVFTLCSFDSCRANINVNTFDFFRGSLLAGCTCVYQGGDGIVGDFAGARSYGDFEVQFQIGSGLPVILSRSYQSSGITDGKVSVGDHYIEWVGNLASLDEVSVPQYDARLVYSKWDLVDDGSYSTLSSKVNSFQNCFDNRRTTFGPQTAYDECLSIFESDKNLILLNKLSKYKSDNGALIYDAETDDNNLYVTLKATPFPTFILDLDAESVGIITLEGKPVITNCIPSQTYQSGQNEVLQFSVKNDADVDNVQFYASVNCEHGLIGFVPNFYMGSYEEKTISVELHPVNPNEQSLNVNCKLTVSDLKSGNSADCNFFGTVEYESGLICEPNNLYCDNVFENVIKCTADGKNKVLYETCTYGCEIVDGQGRCRGEEPPIPPNYCEDCDAFANSLIFGKIFKSQECIKKTFQNSLFCIFAILKLFAIPFIFILSLIFGVQILNKLLRGQYVWLAWVIGVTLSLLIAWLTYILFWLGIVILIIYVIFRVVLNFIPGLNVIRRKRK